MPNLQRGMALLGAAVLVTSVTGCQRYEQGERGQHAKVDKSAIVDAIGADEKKWNEDFHAKSVDALMSHYTSDVVAIFPGGPSMTGAALRKGLEDAVKDPAFDVSFSSDKVEVADSGDLAYSRGHFTVKSTNPKTKQVVSEGGSYITVYKKQGDGSWKVVEDFTAVEPAAAPAAQ